MKHVILLEQIIRDVLCEGEGATIVVETAVLNTEEDKLMRDLHTLIISPSKYNDIKYSTADGTAILVSRRGGRGDDKTFKLSADDLQKWAIVKLNSLSAGLLAKTSSDYVWILDMQDTKLDRRKKPKENRIFATYRFPAFYISRSLLSKSITSSTSGYIQSIGNGALLFDRAKIKDAEWKSTRLNVSPDPVSRATGTIVIPRSELSYGDNSASIISLFKYFYTEPSGHDQLTNFSSVKNSTKFGCELRAACEQFQKEQGLPITGKWDTASIEKANKLHQLNINLLNPDETPDAVYIFSTPSELKQRVDACIIETTPKPETILTPIKYEYKVTKNSIPFHEVQQQMVTWLESIGINNAPKTGDPYKAYIKLKNATSGQITGTYLNITKSAVALIKGMLYNQLNKDIDLDDKYIDEKFINLIK